MRQRKTTPRTINGRKFKENGARTKYERCKRCGDLGHRASKCEMPPADRPDIERIIQKLESGEQRTLGRDKVFEIVQYVYEVEGQRRNLIRAVRAYQVGHGLTREALDGIRCK